MIRNTPFGRKNGMANLFGLFASVLIAIFLAGLGAGITVALVIGVMSGFVIQFLLIRTGRKEE